MDDNLVDSKELKSLYNSIVSLIYDSKEKAYMSVNN